MQMHCVQDNQQRRKFVKWMALQKPLRIKKQHGTQKHYTRNLQKKCNTQF
jgi:hypothetical protein